MAKKEFSFTEAVKEIDKILNAIESGVLDIDKLAGEVKRASELIRQCQKKLRTTEEEISNIFRELI
ncbi:MAG TPA: exodeoxyribonuclease VII small subunit [Bacteroidales bacterium]|jgi:exodeoxyribonuclease VII small subunit|nr:exodeoxyribonuclease VII small subunit [Bacteroidales bacterium]HQH25664.1 exodeoxyribonuclease VII small subunit [Bacteroidales bacterium]HQJ83310.1 exodeoxyribonuclease VII small subunit [Bacteroidales bacterium]